jgi:hypothetical protein
MGHHNGSCLLHPALERKTAPSLKSSIADRGNFIGQISVKLDSGSSMRDVISYLPVGTSM